MRRSHLRLVAFSCLTVILLTQYGCQTRSPSPLQAAQGSNRVEVNSVKDDGATFQEVTQVKTFDQCASASPFKAQVRFSDSASQETQGRLTLGAKGGAQVGISGAAAVALEAAVEQYFQNTVQKTEGHQEGADIEVPARTRQEYTIVWRETRHKGSVAYTEDGQPATVPYDYRVGTEIVSSSVKDLPCETTTGATAVAQVQQTPATATPTRDLPTATPVPTSVPTPTAEVLYNADWSKGLDGWIGSPDWQPVSGMLVNTGDNKFPSSGIIFPPYQPGNVRDYAVEAEMQVIQAGWCGRSYGFIVRGRDSQGPLEGYMIGGINTFCPGGQGSTQIGKWAAPDSSSSNGTLKATEPVTDEKWHHYRVEVRGNVIKLILDNVPILKVTDNTYLQGGLVALWSQTAQVNIRNFRITKLSPTGAS